MKADDPKLIEAIKTKVLWKPPAIKGLNLGVPITDKLIGGQFGQPHVVEEILKEHNLWKNSNGFFIESGAADGVGLSNTLYFELKYNWTGLLVEPNPRYSNHSTSNYYVLRIELEVWNPIVYFFDGRSLPRRVSSSKHYLKYSSIKFH